MSPFPRTMRVGVGGRDVITGTVSTPPWGAPMFVHTVYFWLKEGTPEAARLQLLEDCRTLLTQIPTVRQLYAGPPANTPRKVVDNSYACGLTVLFDAAAGHDVYQDHPLHLDFIERNREHWARVQVYDHLHAQ